MLTWHLASHSEERDYVYHLRVADIALGAACGRMPRWQVVISKGLYVRIAALLELGNAEKG